MFSSIVQAGSKALGGARFSLVNLMPTAFFITFMAALIASGAYTHPAPNLRPVINVFTKNPGWAVAAGFGIFLVAVLLRPFQAALVQFLEGYWRRWSSLEFANDIATERHRRIRNTAEVIFFRASQPQEPSGKDLKEVADYAQRLRKFRRVKNHASLIMNRYPRDIDGYDRLMPTLLGNTLRDGEDYSGGRYGLEMPVVYPRMYPSLSPKLDSAISAQLDMINTTSALCIACGLIAVLSLPLIVRMNWWSLTPIVAALTSILSYRGAIATARGHGRLLATAFDLHRFDMLNSLHYELPITPQKELALNKTLSGFLESHERDAVLRMREFPYKHPVASAEGSTDAVNSPDPDSDHTADR